MYPPGIDEDDLDSILEGVQPPPELLALFKPEPSIAVSEFLEQRFLTQSGSRKIRLESADWFVKQSVNFTPTSIEDIILPSRKTCLGFL
jgi:hypothetical protein